MLYTVNAMTPCDICETATATLLYDSVRDPMAPLEICDGCVTRAGAEHLCTPLQEA